MRCTLKAEYKPVYVAICSWKYQQAEQESRKSQRIKWMLQLRIDLDFGLGKKHKTPTDLRVVNSANFGYQHPYITQRINISNRTERDSTPSHQTNSPFSPKTSGNVVQAFFLNSACPDSHLSTQVLQIPGPMH